MKLRHAVKSAIVLRELPQGSLARLSPSVPTPMQDWVSVGAGESGVSSLISGWCPPEPWGVWSNEHESILTLHYLEMPERDIRIEFEVWALVAGDLSQTIEVCAHGLVLAKWIFTSSENRGRRVVDFPCTLIKPTPFGAALGVRFRSSSLPSPQELGLSDDSRRLGFALNGFRQAFIEFHPGEMSARPLSDIEGKSDGSLGSNAPYNDPQAHPAEGSLSLVAHARRASRRTSTQIRAIVFRALVVPVRILRRMASRWSRLLLRLVAKASFLRTAAGLQRQSSPLREVLNREDQILADVQHLISKSSQLESLVAKQTNLREILVHQDKILSEIQGVTKLISNVDPSMTSAWSALGDRISSTTRLMLDYRVGPQLAELSKLVERTLAPAAEQRVRGPDDQQVSHEATSTLADTYTVLKEGIDPRVQQLLELTAQAHSKLDVLVASTNRMAGRFVLSLADNTLAISNPFGYLIVPTEDVALVAQFAEGQLPDPGALQVLNLLVGPGSTFVDVGANVGFYTLFAARSVGPTGKVISIEPTPRLAALLRLMVRMNGIADRVEIHEQAVGAEAGTAELNVGMPYGLSSIYPLTQSNQKIPVKISPLDEILRGCKPGVVKIDVEGAELDVLRGLTSTLADNTGIVIFIEYGPEHLQRAGVTNAQWFSAVRDLGFKIWEIDDAMGRIRPLRKNGIESIYSINLLLARRLPAALAGIVEGVSS